MRHTCFSMSQRKVSIENYLYKTDTSIRGVSVLRGFTVFPFRRLQQLMKLIAMRRTKTQKMNGKRIVELPERTVFIQKIEMTSQERKIYNTIKNEGKVITDR